MWLFSSSFCDVYFSPRRCLLRWKLAELPITLRNVFGKFAKWYWNKSEQQFVINISTKSWNLLLYCSYFCQSLLLFAMTMVPCFLNLLKISDWVTTLVVTIHTMEILSYFNGVSCVPTSRREAIFLISCPFFHWNYFLNKTKI